MAQVAVLPVQGAAEVGLGREEVLAVLRAQVQVAVRVPGREEVLGQEVVGVLAAQVETEVALVEGQQRQQCSHFCSRFLQPRCNSY